MLDRSVAPQAGAILNPNIQKPHFLTTDSGVPLFLIPSESQPIIKFEVSLKSGVWHEEIPGHSWVTSKMLQEGTAERSSHEIAGSFEFYGSFIDINPGFDGTSISVYSPKRYFKEVAKLLGEILFQPAFADGEIEILKSNKIQQVQINSEKTSFIASRKIREAMFGLQHPYGRSLGISDIKRLNRSGIQEYFDKSFHRSAEFFVSGNVETEELEIINQLSWRKKSVETSQSPQCKNESTKYIFVEKPDSVQTSIRFGWPIPNKSHIDHYKIMMFNEILGGYFSSRLMKNLREEKGYTYGVHSYPLFLQNASFLVVSADVKAESTSDAISEIHKELDILKTQKVEYSELETVKNYMAGSFLTSISTTFELMEKFKSVHSHGLDYSYFDNFFNALNTISAEDILETANNYFNNDNLHTVVVGKK